MLLQDARRTVVCPVHEATWPGSRVSYVVLMSPFSMCVLPVIPFRMNESRCQAKPSQAKVLTGGRRLALRASRRRPVC